MGHRVTEVGLDDQLNALLSELAQRLGKDPAELGGELIREKLRERTSPRGNRGKVQPFRRRP